MTKSKKKSYNRRLFSSFQSFYHLSRFYWIREKLNKLDIEKLKILELGCYDGKILHFLKEYPKKYLGLDANWEQGLDLAKRKWENKSFISFQLCKNPAQLPRGSKWEIGICMETLEHIPNNIVEGYLYQLSKIIDYLLFITIPIERGFPFLIALFFRKNEILSNYTVKDILYSFLGKLNKVERIEHKGFDDNLLISQIKKYFDIIKIEGIFPKFPIISLNLNIGIIAKPKRFL